MAYFSQEKKAKIAPKVKALLKKYNLKGSLSVRHHSTVVLTVKSGTIDFIGNYYETTNLDDRLKRDRLTSLDVNPYWYQDNFTGKAKQFLEDVFAVLNEGNHNNSDIQTDYFDVGHYVDVNIGKWDQPYALVK